MNPGLFRGFLLPKINNIKKEKEIIMKKLIIFFVAVILAFILVKQLKKNRSTTKYTIGILQTASHPALDAARSGFTDALKETFGDTIHCIIQNAQGSIITAHTIAQQFHTNPQIDCFFTIATPAAIALSTVEKKRPIVIAAVTDPQALGLIHPTTNVCGVRDMINVKAEINMLAQLVPQAKTIGILYTSGETNSLTMVQEMHKELEKHNLISLDFTVLNETEIPTAVGLACRKTDALLAPTDNTVAATISLISTITHEHKKPLFVSDNMLVKFGALAARGIDYKESGKQAAAMVQKILIGHKKPAELSIENGHTEKIIINSKIARDLHIIIPEKLKGDLLYVNPE